MIGTEIEMRFWRDDTKEKACLEYSYVPQGLRRHILLEPGQQELVRKDSIPAELNPSHVQVYALKNGNTGVFMAQFPAGPPQPTVLIAARVFVVSAGDQATATAEFAGGSSLYTTYRLKTTDLPCPQVQE